MIQNIRITDVLLCQEYGPLVHQSYVDALEFLKLNPDYSLLKFRDILDLLCEKIMEHCSIKCSKNNLMGKINALQSAGVIGDAVAEGMHQLRELCNVGAYKPWQGVMGQHQDGQYEEMKGQLVQLAAQARENLVIIFELVYEVIFSEKLPFEIDLLEAGGLEEKSLLFDTVRDTSWKSKLKAGLFYESTAENLAGTSGPVLSSKVSYQLKYLRRLAVASYEAACRMSVDVDVLSKILQHKQIILSEDEIIRQHGDLEALFRYAMAVGGDGESDDFQNTAATLLKAAADRGYSAALAYYGAHLYLKEKRYEESLSYLSKAAEQDVSPAHALLCLYYSEGLACTKDFAVAREHVYRGVDSGCPESMAVLGELLHQGIVVKKSSAEAERQLKAAISKGSYRAKRYYIVEFNKLSERISRYGLKLLSEIRTKEIREREAVSLHSRVPGANDPCHCGSGKKYKKCCRA